MAMNLEAVLKIAAKVTGLDDLGRLEKGLIGAEKAAGAAKGGFKAMLDSSAWQGAAVAAAGIGVALGGSVRAAVDFESAMADVRKVVPGLESAEGFKAMSQEIIGMSRELPVSAKGLAEIMAAAGQAGIAKEDLADFTRQAAQMGIAFDISAGEAGEAMAKLRTSLGLSQPQVVDLADAMNYLSNNMASSAAEVTEFMLRSGAVGKQVAMTTEQTAAFGSAMIAAGAAPEVAATSFNNLIKAMSKGESATAAQSSAFKSLGLDVTEVAKSMQVDAVGTIRDVFQRISKMPAEMRVSTISQIFGDEARALTPLIGNMKLFEQAMGLVGDKSKYTGSMLAEFESRSGTSANQFQILKNNIEALAIAVGNGLLPAINGMLFVISPVIGFISDMAGRFPILTGAITLLAAAFVGLVAIAPFISGFITLLGQLATLKIGATIAGWAAVAGPAIIAIKAAFAGFMAFLTGTLLPGLLAFFSGPVGWTVLAVAAVVAMAVAFREPIGKFFVWLGEAIPKAFSGLLTVLTNLREPIGQFFAWLGGAIQQGFSNLMALLQPIFVQPFIDLWNNVLRGPITAMFAWLGEYLQTSMQNALALAYAVFVLPWQLLWEAVKGPVTAFFGWIGGAVQAGMAAALNLAYAVFVQPWVDLWNNVLRKPVADGIKWIQGAWAEISKFFVNNVTTPISKAWTALATFLPKAISTVGRQVNTVWASITKFFTDNVTTPISKAWTTMVEFLPKAMSAVGQQVNSIFQGIVNTVKSVIRSVFQFVVNAVNAVSFQINRVIATVNGLAARFGGPQFNYLPTLSVPAFAQGAVVTGPTLALVGDGGEPEYIIPASKMQTASQNYLGGARGGAVIPAFANGGFVGSSRSGAGAAAPAGGGSASAQINVTTGPVMQVDNERYVTLADLERAMRMTADGVYASLRTPAGRYAMGTR